MDIKKLYDLSGKVAVVTGGGDGIGRGVCRTLAHAGASVVVSDLDLVKAQETSRLIRQEGGRAIPVVCNVLDSENLGNLVNTAVRGYGTVNILVNNAGLGGGGRENPFKIDRQYVERIYAVNVFAPWELSKLVAPGATRTKALASVLTPEIEKKMLANTPIKRLGEVEDIANAVLFFASPVSAWVSGQTLMVNGGGVQTL